LRFSDPDFDAFFAKSATIRFRQPTGYSSMNAYERKEPIPIDPVKLDRLAQVAVRVGLQLEAGQDLLMTAPTTALPLVRRVAEHAYRAGAGLVTPILSDEVVTLSRYRFGQDAGFDRAADWLYDGMATAFAGNTARLAIVGDNPMLLAGEDPIKVARASKANSIAYKPALERIVNFDINWNIIAYPSPSWARLVFPDDEENVAVAKLADAIFSASRVDREDAIAAWQEHNATLLGRTQWLNGKRFDALHYLGPGTDLTIGLAHGHEWQGGASTAKNGITCNANIPTEEVFTTPHARRVSGRVVSTKPLSYQGSLIEGIAVRFEEGHIVEARATRGEEVLNKVLDTDEGARRLGEVAFIADFEEPVVVLQHLVRRDRRLPHRAGPMLFEMFRRRCETHARADRGARRQHKPHPHRLDDRFRPDRHRRPLCGWPARAGVPQGRVGLNS